jgi:hypothetical protein
MKLTFLQVDQAFNRVVWGESGRAVARDLGVDESALRFHFRKGVTPRYVREIALCKFHAEQMRDRLGDDDRRAVDRLVAKAVDRRNTA